MYAIVGTDFGTPPSFFMSTGCTPEQQERMKIMKTVRDEAAQIQDKKRISTAIKANAPQPDHCKFEVVKNFLGYIKAKRKLKYGTLVL